MENLVMTEIKGNVAVIRMNQPQSMNSMTPALCNALHEAVLACDNNDDVRVVVLTGEGKAFCAGGDLHELESYDIPYEASLYVHRAGMAAAAIFHSKKPYIAMVNGAAAGAGFNLAITCDFVFASAKAKFTQAFSSIGLASDCGGNYLLPMLVGPARAKELMMLPEMLTAQEAKDLGIVRTVEEPEKLEAAVMNFAERLAKRPPLAIAATKRLVNDHSKLTFDEMRYLEEQVQGGLIVSRDAREGIKAFFEKREAEFVGK